MKNCSSSNLFQQKEKKKIAFRLSRSKQRIFSRWQNKRRFTAKKVKKNLPKHAEEQRLIA
jgi:hypothetical protein